MSWIRHLFRTKAGRNKLYREIDKELSFHIDELTRENIGAGMSPEEARRQARIAFGGERQIAEEARRSWGIPWVDDFLHDVRFGCRMLLKSPGYTIAAILALSIGIGPNTAFFTFFDAIFLRPVPVPISDQVVVLEKTVPRERFPIYDFSYPEYQYYRDHNTTLDALSVHIPNPELLMSTAPGSAESVSGLTVSSSYFSVMGVAPAVGISFTAEDDLQTAPPYRAMLSENFWELRFGRDPQILGKELIFGDKRAVIIGITPRDFMGSRPSVPDVWLPLAARDQTCCRLEGRLKPGVSRQQAQAELTQVARAFSANSPTPDPEWTLSLSEPTPGFLRNSTLSREPARRLIVFSLFQAAIGMVLLIACANVSGLLLGKAVSRQKEVAVRLSLGASRGRLVRQLLTEALLIAQVAGLLGFLMSWWILRALMLMLVSTPDGSGASYLLNMLTPDHRMVLYLLGISTVTAVAFSLSPALQTTRLNLTESLNDEMPAFGGRRKSFHRIVSAQVAVCLMLLIGARTIAGSARPLLTSDLGFDADRVIAIAVPDPLRSRELQTRLAVLPDIASFASASRIPFSRDRGLSSPILPHGANSMPNSEEQVRSPQYSLMFVSTRYFETLGIPVLRGRSFTEQEMSSRAPVAVVSNALAGKLWPGENPIGKTITVGSSAEMSSNVETPPYFPSLDVIGVVRDVSNSPLTASYPGLLYVPSQREGWESNLFIRASNNPNVLAGILSRELQSIDNDLSVTVRTMNSVMVDDNPAFVVIRTIGTMFSVLGLLGLMLASVGIYSMVGYAVSQQTREIGIRMALGAKRTEVRRLILVRSMRPIAKGITAGLVLGVIVSLLISRAFAPLKFLDARVLAEISALVVVIGLVAAYIPARRAMNLDPSAALRKQ